MSILDVRTVPIDPTSRDRLAKAGLDYRLVEGDALGDHLRAEHRGFLEGEPTDETIAEELALHRERRVIGVYDPDAIQSLPVATEFSWVTPLTVLGGEVPMWAVGGMTVAATHRRRGIARAILEGELRAAAGAGVAIAGLTASEATIYGRYGFASATPAASVTIDTQRAGWGSPEPAARIAFVDRGQLADDLGALHERTRSSRLGDIAPWPRRWRQESGLTPEAEKPRQVRGVRAIDQSGELVGAMAFELVEGPDFQHHTFRVRHLIAVTPDARAALWRFAINYDLVSTVTASRQPIDDPLPWQVHDMNGVEQRISEHGWLRILDVPAALKARTLNGAFGVRIAVTDLLGIADGSWTLTQLGSERTRVEPLADDRQAEVTLDVGALSAAYLGAVRLETLAAAGRVSGSPDKIRTFSEALSTPTAPHLSIKY